MTGALKRARGSAGRPRHLATGEQVDVEVRHGFAGVRAVVDDKAKAVGELELAGELAGDEQEMAEDGFIGGRGVADSRDDFFRNEEQVNGRLRLDVMKSEAEIVFVLDARGNFAGDDTFEQSLGHGKRKLPELGA